MNWSVVPLYCFHTSPPPAPPPDSWPQPKVPRTVDPTKPTPVIFRKSRRDNLLRAIRTPPLALFIRPPSRSLCHIIVLKDSVGKHRASFRSSRSWSVAALSCLGV